MSAEETIFERSLYTEASGHRLLDRASIDAIHRKSIARYEYWPMSVVGNSREWMRKSLLFAMHRHRHCLRPWTSGLTILL